jgi:UDP-2,4-diacetamido-2,4,6-trideoxy-beta-L-altropyranose hydrolase
VKLLVRVDAGPAIGGGHIMRCLTLARAATERGWSATFVTRGLDPALLSAVKGYGVDVIELPGSDVTQNAASYVSWLGASPDQDAAQTREILSAEDPDWLIVDHYGVGQDWLSAMPAATKIAYLDDLDRFDLRCDLIVDQTRLTPARYGKGARAVLSGPNYALLRPEFQADAPVRTTLKRLLVMPGAGDAYGLATLALEASEGLGLEAIDVVVGPLADTRGALDTLAARLPNVVLHYNVKDVSGLFLAADLAVGAGGMSAWERCALGLPCVMVAVAPNQQRICKDLSDAGAAVFAKGDVASIRAAIEAADIPAMSARAKEICDGRGAERVLDVLAARLDPLSDADAGQLLAWRNEPHIRSVSLTQHEIDPDEHAAWFAKARVRGDGMWRIYSEGGRKLGFISASGDGEVWRWNFYIGAPDAPKGAGGRMLAGFLREAFKVVDRIEADVLADNKVSIHLHERLGFVHIAQQAGGAYRFALNKEDWLAYARV